MDFKYLFLKSIYIYFFFFFAKLVYYIEEKYLVIKCIMIVKINIIHLITKYSSFKKCIIDIINKLI